MDFFDRLWENKRPSKIGDFERFFLRAVKVTVLQTDYTLWLSLVSRL